MSKAKMCVQQLVPALFVDSFGLSLVHAPKYAYIRMYHAFEQILLKTIRGMLSGLILELMSRAISAVNWGGHAGAMLSVIFRAG